MFTRCPKCLTVHTLNASLLAHAGGAVRCGYCQNEFNALTCLFDHWPVTSSQPPAVGTHTGPPVLGRVGPATETIPNAETGDPEEQREDTDQNRTVWVTIFILLLIVTASNLAWTFREPLMKVPALRGFLVNAGILEQAADPAFRDIDRFHLVSRDMHKHPARTGMLALSIIFVNRADQSQPWPAIEVTLTGVDNEPVAQRVFQPAEYLPAGTGLTAGLGPDIHVPVLLEFADPGARAVGFELAFK